MTTLLSPVGRFVGGSLTKPQDKDAEGNPLTYKKGPDAGKPRVNYFVALAVAKGAEQHWAQTEWGSKIWKIGHDLFPQGQADLPSFAWKIEDGDDKTPHASKDPNRIGRINANTEGYPGCWILKTTSGFVSELFQRDEAHPANSNLGWKPINADAIKPGHYLEIEVDVVSNGSMQQPGIFLNHKKIAWRGYGQELQFGSDVSEAGFGASPLPAGASAVPLGGFTPPVAPAAGGFAPPAVPGSLPPPALAGFMPPPVAAPAAPPAPAFLQVPPPAAPVHVMLPAAKGIAYEAYITAGWTDATLVQMGMMAK